MAVKRLILPALIGVALLLSASMNAAFGESARGGSVRGTMRANARWVEYTPNFFQGPYAGRKGSGAESPSGPAPRLPERFGGAAAPAWTRPRDLDLGAVRISPKVTVGWKRIDLHFNLDAPQVRIGGGTLGVFRVNSAFRSLLDIDPIDIRLRRGDVWVGGVGFDAMIGPDLGVSFGVEWNAGRRIKIEVEEAPIVGSVRSGRTTLTAWDDSRLTRRKASLAFKYRVFGGLSLLAGMKWESTSLSLNYDTAPRIVSGFPFPLGPLHPYEARIRGISAKLKTRIKTPSFGVEYNSPGLRTSLNVGFPFASLQLPIRLSHDGPYFVGFLFPLFATYRADISERLRYSLDRAGLSLEANCEWETNLREGVNLSLWAHGRWFRIKGEGSIGLNGSSTPGLAIFTFLLPLPEPPYSAVRAGDAELTETTVSLGVKARIDF